MTKVHHRRAPVKPPVPRTRVRKAAPVVTRGEAAGQGRLNGTAKFKQRSHLVPNEVADMMLVTPVTVRQWSARGELRSVTTPGGHRRYLLSDVEAFARSRRAAVAGLPASRPEDRLRLLRRLLEEAEQLIWTDRRLQSGRALTPLETKVLAAAEIARK